MSRRETEQQLFSLAKGKAGANGLELIRFEDSLNYPDLNLEFAERPFFRLSRSVGGALRWSVDLWPSEDEFALIKWDPEHKGPVLNLPRYWTILDAVEEMITLIAEENIAADAKFRRRPHPSLRRRR